ncbi:hypothetical protein B4U84_22035 [Westiellopsis prolifica IICB1]|nr:hypothetical protein B4U84_22035 [Westiellopsis prolifica IICB1]
MTYKIAVVAPRMVSGEVGGAERFHLGLTNSLNSTDTNTDLIQVVIDESTFEAIEESYLRCYDLDLSAYDAVISTKAPTYLVRHHNHICYLQHTIRVFYDMFEKEFPYADATLNSRRELIHKLDTGALRTPRTRKVFSQGHEIKHRLLHWNGIDSEVLYPGIVINCAFPGNYEYIFMPGRLHRWKRVDLVIEAMRYVKHPVHLKIAGTGEDEKQLRILAANDERIEFLGRVPDEELVNLYANALAVPFVPIREDYGYVTLEAFAHAKPVITCEDSGEPLQFVKNGDTGFVVPPHPKEIAKAINYFVENPEKTKSMGHKGKEDTSYITWSNVSQTLLSCLQSKRG